MNNDTPLNHPLEAASTLAHIEKLQRHRSYRDARGLFFVEGVRNFVEAVDQHASIEALVYSERLLTSAVARKLVRRLKRAGVSFACVSPDQFRQFSRLEQASGISAILRQQVHRLPQLQPRSHTCWVALSNVRSPGNFGTLLRTAAASGAAGFILLGNQVDPFDPAVVRASMGTLFKQTLVRAELEDLRDWAQLHHVQIVGASPAGSVDYDQVNYASSTVLMLGEERQGLTEAQRSVCHQLVRIPMQPGVDSLNLAVAGSLLLYQVNRSWGR